MHLHYTLLIPKKSRRLAKKIINNLFDSFKLFSYTEVECENKYLWGVILNA